MSTIKKITRKELAAILTKGPRGCTFIGFDALTEMKLNGGKAAPAAAAKKPVARKAGAKKKVA